MVSRIYEIDQCLKSKWPERNPAENVCEMSGFSASGEQKADRVFVRKIVWEAGTESVHTFIVKGYQLK